ncbi:MAG TPA: TetR-like C-terminal domain-containing protein, partial [Candidatus Acidoferrum sp.]|nr:TetR-like C-terminal domain-containing protein [Candidatus Acidoferrum sp.]
VAGMDALQRLVAIRAKTELADVVARAAAGKAGAQALTAMFRACRPWAKAHPGRYAASVRAPEAADEQDIEASCASPPWNCTTLSYWPWACYGSPISAWTEHWPSG